MSETYIGAREARSQFADLLGRVRYGGDEVIVERFGKPMAAMIPPKLYRNLIAERQARFEVIDRLRQHLPDISSEEIMADIEEAIAAVRAADVEDRS